MPVYELACEFDIVRRIGWTDEDLGTHIDSVFERLHQAADVIGMSATSNLDTGRSKITLRYEADRDDDPERLGRTTLGVAVRASSGGHNGLLPLAEEAALKPQRGQWSGLRTPTWSVRQVTIEEVPRPS
jgi:hypothetical protein